MEFYFYLNIALISKIWNVYIWHKVGTLSIMRHNSNYISSLRYVDWLIDAFLNVNLFFFFTVAGFKTAKLLCSCGSTAEYCTLNISILWRPNWVLFTVRSLVGDKAPAIQTSVSMEYASTGVNSVASRLEAVWGEFATAVHKGLKRKQPSWINWPSLCKAGTV